MKTTQELAEIIKRSEFNNDEESRCNLIQLSNFVESSRDKLNEFHARARGLANIVGLLTILMMKTNALVPDDLLIFDLHFWKKLDALKDILMEGLAGITSRIQLEVGILDEVEEQQRENIRIGNECEKEARGFTRNARPEQMWPNATADIFGGDIDILAHGGDRWGLALIECKAGGGRVVPNPDIPNGIIVNANRNPNPNHDKAFWQVANRTRILEQHCKVSIQPIICVCGQENEPFEHEFTIDEQTFMIKVCSARALRSVLREIPPIPDSGWKGCLVELLGQPGDNGNIDWSRQD